MLTLMVPGTAWANTQSPCGKLNPTWDGAPVTMVDEAFLLLASPASLILIFLTLLALRFRHQWGALVVVILWTAFVSFVAMGGRAQGLAEGCVGSPVLFISLVAAICIGMIIYTTPRESRAQ